MLSRLEVVGLLIALLCAVAAYFVDRQDQLITRQRVAEQLGELEQQVPERRLLKEPSWVV